MRDVSVVELPTARYWVRRMPGFRIPPFLPEYGFDNLRRLDGLRYDLLPWVAHRYQCYWVSLTDMDRGIARGDLTWARILPTIMPIFTS